MRIAIVGHSLAHIRQQGFFRTLSRQGLQVDLYCPDRWGNLKAKHLQESSYHIMPLPCLGEPDMYRYHLVGLGERLQEQRPDAVYIQQEIGCAITSSVLAIAKELDANAAVFVWENLRPLTPDQEALLDQFDLVVCGNSEAQRIHSPAKSVIVLPQVGVDTDHFQVRPGTERSVDVAFIGRPVPEKGVNALMMAWPTAKLAHWTDWKLLPWVYSQAKVVVTFSQDTPFWKEQAMPYVAVEAMATGCAVVASDGGAIPFWLGGGFAEACPGAAIVPQQDIAGLRTAIAASLADWEARGAAGRAWVQKYLSSSVIAQRMKAELEALVQQEVPGAR